MRVVLFAVVGCLAVGCGGKVSDTDSDEIEDQDRDTESPTVLPGGRYQAD